MKEKEITIIKAAIKLFAKKGFNATSIQEIVNDAGISKGAFYLYFKSKESLLLAIFEYYFEEIETKISEISLKGLSSREKFREQLVVYCNEVKNHQEFIIMQARENALPFNDEVHSFLIKMRTEQYKFYRRHLLAIYGKAAETLIEDATVLIKGMVDAYLEFIMFDKESFDIEKWSHFLLGRIDDVMGGLEKSGETPILTNANLGNSFFGGIDKGLDELLLELKELVMEHGNSEEYEETMGILLEEANSGSPRKAVIKGMLSNLAGVREAQRHIAGVARMYGIEQNERN